MELLLLTALLVGGFGLVAVFGRRGASPVASAPRAPLRPASPPPAMAGGDDDEDDDYVQFDIPPGVTRPPGEWEVFRDHQDVVGERYRLENALTFFRGIQEAVAQVRAQEVVKLGFFGVELRREPGNPVDPQAVAVDGFWTTDPKVAASQERIHLGYLPAGLAAHMAASLVPDAELGAELVSIEIDPDDEDDMVNVTIHVLNRPGDVLQPARRR